MITFFFSPVSHGIKTVINLQRPGEHASCGNPLEQESGFTYLPEAFMEAGSKSLHLPFMRYQEGHPDLSAQLFHHRVIEWPLLGGGGAEWGRRAPYREDELTDSR